MHVLVSPYYLCRLFKAHLNTSPLGYLTHLRVEVARRLLERSNLTVTEVAHLVGYANPAYLTRLFYKFFGNPPAKLRTK